MILTSGSCSACKPDLCTTLKPVAGRLEHGPHLRLEHGPHLRRRALMSAVCWEAVEMEQMKAMAAEMKAMQEVNQGLPTPMLSLVSVTPSLSACAWRLPTMRTSSTRRSMLATRRSSRRKRRCLAPAPALS